MSLSLALAGMLAACASGHESPCPAGETSCVGVCTDMQTDPRNCSSCGYHCPSGVPCVRGRCDACDLDPDNRRCGATCANIQHDERNCGVCGRTCSSGTCVRGECVPFICEGGAGQVACGNDCIDIRFDPNNCGSCGHVCSADQSCSNGECLCPAGWTDCDGPCVDTRIDPMNCGACGLACGLGATCVDGGCVFTGCPTGTQQCRDRCVSIGDRDNCGGCGCRCSEPTPLCLLDRPRTSASCVGDCSAAQIRCGGPGCVNPAADPENCGGCGVRVPDLHACAAGIPTCVQQTCDGECVANNDPRHCGACGVACTGATPVCRIDWIAGPLCDAACNAGETSCAGRCIDAETDPYNCGSCGHACGAHQRCAGGACECTGRWVGCPDASGVLRCMPEDVLNCGACGHACSPGQCCSLGACVTAP